MTPSFFSNQESRKETWLLFAATLALCIEILALLYQLRLISLPGTRRASVSDERRIGSLTLRERSVTSRAPNSLSWYPLAGGDAIHLNDTVMTGSGAKARIELGTSGEISLEPDTLIRFSDERRWTEGLTVVNLEVNQGTLRLKSQKDPVRLMVRNRRVELGPESEVVFERSSGGADSEMEVAKGKALVSQDSVEAGADVILKEGDRVSLPEGAGTIAPPQPAVVRLGARSPRAGSRIFAKTEVEEIVLSWEGNEGDRLEWDKSEAFSDARSQAAMGEVRLGLKPGQYFWRVRRGTRVSEGASFLVVPPIEYELRGPASKSPLRRSKKVKLDWAKIEGAAEYRVEVASDEAFTRLQWEGKTREAEVELPLLPGGKYFWRVRAVSSQWGEWPASEMRFFTVKAPLAAPKAKGAKMLDAKPVTEPPPKKGGWLKRATDLLIAVGNWLIPEAQAAEKSVDAILAWQFNWTPIEGAAGYRLEISLDPDFKKITARKEVEMTSVSLVLPPGKRYYWRVAAFDEDRELGRFSQAEKVDAPNGRIQRGALRMPASIVKAPPPRPPAPPRSQGYGFLIPSWVRLGAGGGFVSQSVSGPSESLSSTGFPLGKFEAYLHRTIAGSELELGFSLQRLRYQTKDGAIASFQPDLVSSQFETQFLYKGFGYFRNFPVTVGLLYRSLNDLHRVGAETAGVGKVSQIGALVGLSPWQGSDPASFWQTDLLVEFSPLGGAKGGGLWLRGRYGLWNSVKPLTAEIQVLLHPSLRSVSVGSRSQLNLETSVALVIGGLFDVSPRWVD